MTPAKPTSTTKALARTLTKPRKQRYALRLYVAGMKPRSAHAIANITGICEEHLKGRYDLQVIDLYRQPVLADEEQIVAVPTLIKQLPRPVRRMIGDLSDREQVLLGLDLPHGALTGATAP